MAAYYNEIDPYAAEWLRRLIAEGHIVPGDVDERDIRDVSPDDLRSYTQCHFFAGIGVWSYALRLAGWPDHRPVWTGSCPCQPYSAAGRGGGAADERHLWPHWHHLVRLRRPGVVFGEQVASKAGLGWLDLVSADLEGEGYALGVQDLCAAGFGAPHIRQRLFFVGVRGLADASCFSGGPGFRNPRPIGVGRSVTGDGGGLVGAESRLGHHHHHHQGLSACERGALGGTWGRQEGRATEQSGGPSRGLAFADNLEWGGQPSAAGGYYGGGATARRFEGHGQLGARGELHGLAYTDDERLNWSQDAGAGASRAEQGDGAQERREARIFQSQRDSASCDRPGPTNGRWADADWLHCRDGRWRPVEPRTFPLAHGAAARVGRLRAYGNAIVADVAAEFVAAFLDAEADGFAADLGPGGLSDIEALL